MRSMDRTEIKVEEAAERMVGKAVIEAMKRSSRAREMVTKLLGDDVDLEGGCHDVQVDVVDRPEDLLVLINLPGVEKSDIDLQLTEDLLTVTAKGIEQEGRYIRRERPGILKREIKLPAEVKPEEARAKSQNGVLEVQLPKLVVVNTKRVKID